jgi:hypothetical protein
MIYRTPKARGCLLVLKVYEAKVEGTKRARFSWEKHKKSEKVERNQS